MKMSLKTGIAAALIASATFAGGAVAQDMYGNTQGRAPNLDQNEAVDTMSTGSVRNDNGYRYGNNSSVGAGIYSSPNRGDYYEGVLRPQD